MSSNRALPTTLAQTGNRRKMQSDGFDPELLDVPNIDQDLKCFVCHSVPKHPHEFQQCGHLGCLTCLQTSLMHKSACPMCRVPATDEDIRASAFATNKISGLLSRCPNVDKGCELKTQLGKYGERLAEHLQKCQFQEIFCELCSELVMRSTMETHLRENMRTHFQVVLSKTKSQEEQIAQLGLEKNYLQNDVKMLRSFHFANEREIKRLRLSISQLSQSVTEIAKSLSSKSQTQTRNGNTMSINAELRHVSKDCPVKEVVSTSAFWVMGARWSICASFIGATGLRTRSLSIFLKREQECDSDNAVDKPFLELAKITLSNISFVVFGRDPVHPSVKLERKMSKPYQFDAGDSWGFPKFFSLQAIYDAKAYLPDADDAITVGVRFTCQYAPCDPVVSGVISLPRALSDTRKRKREPCPESDC